MLIVLPPVPRAPELVTVRLPVLTVTVPVNELAAVSTSVPAPSLVKLVNPDRAPAVVATDALTVADPVPDRAPRVTAAPPWPWTVRLVPALKVTVPTDPVAAWTSRTEFAVTVRLLPDRLPPRTR